MENEKTKPASYQKFLRAISLTLSGICLVFAVLSFLDIVPLMVAIFFLFASNMISCCSDWKERPVFNTVMIGIDCFLLGAIIVALLLK